MSTTQLSSQAQIALDRLWPRIRNRYARHQRRERLPEFRAALEQDFPRLLERLTGLYHDQWDFFYHLEQLLLSAARQWLNEEQAPHKYRQEDHDWIESEQSIGATGYVDLFATDLNGLSRKLSYLKELGISYLHLMPFFDTPEGDSDGGYAIRDYGSVNPRVGDMKDLHALSRSLQQQDVKLVLDFVFNHTSDQHEWALKAKAGDPQYQQYYWLFTDPAERDAYGEQLRDIFPGKRQGCFTWNDDVDAWVWTTFNSFQWDLNYSNPAVFHAMCREMLKLVDAGADVIRLDALAFTWKQKGTVCENLPQAHQLIQAFNAFLRISAPHVVLKSEAIVAPDDVIQYISPDECALSYNPNLMALMWEALATRQTRLLINGSRERSLLPEGSVWVNYLRSHDDIGWAFADSDAWFSGINPQDHRYFLNQFYTGQFPGSFARGVPFQPDPRTGDCRISGTLASLAGLEKAIENSDQVEHELALKRILLLHGTMFAFKGIPLIYLGDELGMLNDHSYVNHPAHANDSRWVHRVPSDDVKASRRYESGRIEKDVFSGLQRMIGIRSEHSVFGHGDLQIEPQHDTHLFIFRRVGSQEAVLVIANFSEHPRSLSPAQCHELGLSSQSHDLLSGRTLTTESDVSIGPYELLWLATPYTH